MCWLLHKYIYQISSASTLAQTHCTINLISNHTGLSDADLIVSAQKLQGFAIQLNRLYYCEMFYTFIKVLRLLWYVFRIISTFKTHFVPKIVKKKMLLCHDYILIFALRLKLFKKTLDFSWPLSILHCLRIYPSKPFSLIFLPLVLPELNFCQQNLTLRKLRNLKAT